MSSNWIRTDIQRKQSEIQNLQKQIAAENKKESENTERILRVRSSIRSTSSVSLLKSKQNEVERYERDILSSQKKKADLSKKLSEKTIELHKLEKKLFEEQQKEQKKYQDKLEKQRKDERSHFQKELSRLRAEEASKQSKLFEQIAFQDLRGLEEIEVNNKYDFFISHASEDKEEIVRPLAEKLIERGFSVWYDDFQLKVGDKLRRSIDKGLSSSRFGIVVFSPDFFQKNWTQYELDGLVQIEMSGKKAILPLWHKVSKDEVMNFSPSLADMVALNTASFTIDELVEKLSEVLNK